MKQREKYLMFENVNLSTVPIRVFIRLKLLCLNFNEAAVSAPKIGDEQRQ